MINILSPRPPENCSHFFRIFPNISEYFRMKKFSQVRISGKGTSSFSVPLFCQVAGQDSVFVETSQNNRFYNNTGLTKQRMTVAAFLDVFMSPDRKQDYYLAEQGLYQCPALLEDVAVPEFADFMNVDRTQIWIGAGGQVRVWSFGNEGCLGLISGASVAALDFIQRCRDARP